jgi:hypothetical protein
MERAVYAVLRAGSAPPADGSEPCPVHGRLYCSCPAAMGSASPAAPAVERIAAQVTEAMAANPTEAYRMGYAAGFSEGRRAEREDGTPPAAPVSLDSLMWRIADVVEDRSGLTRRQSEDVAREVLRIAQRAAPPAAPDGERQRIEHAIRYLEHFVDYQPGQWGTPQREKAESCLRILSEVALRSASPQSQEAE